jgi:hypothetical protein
VFVLDWGLNYWKALEQSSFQNYSREVWVCLEDLVEDQTNELEEYPVPLEPVRLP